MIRYYIVHQIDEVQRQPMGRKPKNRDPKHWRTVCEKNEEVKFSATWWMTLRIIRNCIKSRTPHIAERNTWNDETMYIIGLAPKFSSTIPIRRRINEFEFEFESLFLCFIRCSLPNFVCRWSFQSQHGFVSDWLIMFSTFFYS